MQGSGNLMACRVTTRSYKMYVVPILRGSRQTYSSEHTHFTENIRIPGNNVQPRRWRRLSPSFVRSIWCVARRPDRYCSDQACPFTISEMDDLPRQSIMLLIPRLLTDIITILRRTNIWFDTKMPYPASISCHCHYQTLPVRNILSKFIQILWF